MKYHAQSKQFTIPKDNLDSIYYSLIYAIRHIRTIAGLPMTRYKREGCLSDADHAQKGILDAAKAIGIDMGAEWGEQLDVSEEAIK